VLRGTARIGQKALFPTQGPLAAYHHSSCQMPVILFKLLQKKFLVELWRSCMSTRAQSIWRPSPFKDELSLVLHRITMMVGALAYALFIAQLLILNNILLYSASALLGVGAALIWTGQVGSFSRLDHVPDPDFRIL
jgi:hypothetical protein